MIITKEEESLLDADEEFYGEQSDLAPPPYTPPPYDEPESEEVPTTHSDFGGYAPPSSRIRRSNFVKRQHLNNTIRDLFLIDPNLTLPDPLNCEIPITDSSTNDRKVREDQEEDKSVNLRVESVHGSIGAEVWVLPRSSQVSESSGDATYPKEKKRNPVSLVTRSNNGSVSLVLYADASKQPIEIKVSSRNGSVRTLLPRSFTGPVTIRRHSGSSFSNLFIERLKVFSEEGGVLKGFLGDPESENYVEGEWTGSSLDIGSRNGGVRVACVDESDRLTQSDKITPLRLTDESLDNPTDEMATEI